jgi:RNA polymerase sigma factor (sigma-70 family)
MDGQNLALASLKVSYAMSTNVIPPKTTDTWKPSELVGDRETWSNTRLVRECVQGSEEAWSALIGKYKRLIFSIPVKYGFSRDEASDIFQAVCLEMLSELPKLRAPDALPKWIIQVTSHKCFHSKRQQQRVEVTDPSSAIFEQNVTPRTDEILRQAEEEQKLRNAISEIQPRCQRLVQMLFFEEPVRPYQEVAKILGLALGSIGFIRQRCLERLRKKLLESGFE